MKKLITGRVVTGTFAAHVEANCERNAALYSGEFGKGRLARFSDKGRFITTEDLRQYAPAHLHRERSRQAQV